MNAIELLKEDHDKVDKFFQKIKATEGEDHKEIFEKIQMELDVHAHIEETIFYPAIKQDGDEELTKLIDEGVQEHHQVKIFLREIAGLSDESEVFEPKLKVLMENVEHHVQEEEGQMFPMIEKQFDASILEELGKQMETEKKSFQKTQSAGAGR